MDFETFLGRFGKSLRTRNSKPAPDGLLVGRRPYEIPLGKELGKISIRVDPWEAEHLFLLAGRAKQAIVEVGRWWGGSTFLLACANDRTPIYSIDLAPKDDDGLRKALSRAGRGANLELLTGSSTAAWPDLPAPDLVFLDGDSTQNGLRADLERWWPVLAYGGHLLVHDCVNFKPKQAALLDFFDTSDFPVETVRSPYVSTYFWTTEQGSLAHYRKPRTRW